jgi:hypothetical protein
MHPILGNRSYSRVGSIGGNLHQAAQNSPTTRQYQSKLTQILNNRTNI